MNLITGNVAAGMEQQSTATREISHNMQKAAQATETLEGNVQGISSAAKNTMQAAEIIEVNGNELLEHSMEMDNQLKNFMNKMKQSQAA